MHPLLQESPSAKSSPTTIAVNEYDDEDGDNNKGGGEGGVFMAPIVAKIAFSEIFTSNKNSHCHQGKACLHPSETW